MLTAGPAVDADAGVAGTLGLAGSARRSVDGYIGRADAAHLIEQYFLVEDRNGNVTLRLTEIVMSSARRSWRPFRGRRSPFP